MFLFILRVKASSCSERSEGIALDVKSSIAEMFELEGPVAWIKGIPGQEQAKINISAYNWDASPLHWPCLQCPTFKTQSSSLPNLDLREQNIPEITAVDELILKAGDSAPALVKLRMPWTLMT